MWNMILYQLAGIAMTVIIVTIGLIVYHLIISK